jgi:transposase
MPAAIALRGDYESAQLRELARQSEDADQVRRLLALALVYDGGSRSAGARAGGVGLQTFRDWVLRFNAKGPAGLVDGKAPGRVPRLDRAQRGELAQHAIHAERTYRDSGALCAQKLCTIGELPTW